MARVEGELGAFCGVGPAVWLALAAAVVMHEGTKAAESTSLATASIALRARVFGPRAVRPEGGHNLADADLFGTVRTQLLLKPRVSLYRLCFGNRAGIGRL